MKLKKYLSVLPILLMTSCSQKYTKMDYAPGIEKEQGLSFNVDMYRFSSQHDYYSIIHMTFENIQNNGSEYFKNLKSTFSAENVNYLYTDDSVFIFSDSTSSNDEPYKYCYALKPSFYSTGLVLTDNKAIEALFYFPSHLEKCLSDSTSSTTETTTFLELVSFYRPLSNYPIDEINQTIKLEYYVKEDNSSLYSVDNTYVLTLFLKEGEIHIQKSKNV